MCGISDHNPPVSIWFLILVLTMLGGLTLGQPTQAFAVDCPEHKQAIENPSPLKESPVFDDRSHPVVWWMLGGLGIMMIGVFGWFQRRRQANMVNVPTSPVPLVPHPELVENRPSQQWRQVIVLPRHQMKGHSLRRPSRSRALVHCPRFRLSQTLSP